MPELPDIAVYIEALEARILGQELVRVRIAHPFLLRTADPPISDVEGKTVRELRRLGKRIALGLDDELWLVLHLVIAGRLHRTAAGAALPGKRGLAAFDFADGRLILTEAAATPARRRARCERGFRAKNRLEISAARCMVRAQDLVYQQAGPG